VDELRVPNLKYNRSRLTSYFQYRYRFVGLSVSSTCPRSAIRNVIPFSRKFHSTTGAVLIRPCALQWVDPSESVRTYSRIISNCFKNGFFRRIVLAKKQKTILVFIRWRKVIIEFSNVSGTAFFVAVGRYMLYSHINN